MTPEEVKLINNLSLRITYYSNCVNAALLGFFCIVISYDWTRKTPLSNTSFFIISFANSTLNLAWVIIQLIYKDISITWVKTILYIIWDIAFMFDGWILPVLSFNRFTALIYPISYNTTWSNRNTVTIISVILLFIIFCSSFLHIFVTNSREKTLFYFIMGMLNLIASTIGLIFSIICLLKKNPALQKSKAHIERKLLLTSLSVTVCHCIVDMYSIIDMLSELNENIKIEFFQNPICDLLMVIFSFGLFGGMVILLFINR